MSVPRPYDVIDDVARRVAATIPDEKIPEVLELIQSVARWPGTLLPELVLCLRERAADGAGADSNR